MTNQEGIQKGKEGHSLLVVVLLRGSRGKWVEVIYLHATCNVHFSQSNSFVIIIIIIIVHGFVCVNYKKTKNNLWKKLNRRELPSRLLIPSDIITAVSYCNMSMRE